MMKNKVTIDEFWQFVQANPDENFELINGIITAVPNAIPAYGNIISNCNRLFLNHLFDDDSGCYFYSKMLCQIDDENCPQPDLVLVCNSSVESDLLAYPTMVGEILSPNKKNHMEKLLCYQSCGSIQEILLIEQDKMAITMLKRKNENTWTQQQYHSPNDVIVFESIDFSVKVADIYHKPIFHKPEKRHDCTPINH